MKQYQKVTNEGSDGPLTPDHNNDGAPNTASQGSDVTMTEDKENRLEQERKGKVNKNHDDKRTPFTQQPINVELIKLD